MNEIEQAEHILDDNTATREQVQAAYDQLKAWHNNEAHEKTCTCHARLLLDTLEFDLLVWVDGMPRIVGAERQSSTDRLLNAILGQK